MKPNYYIRKKEVIMKRLDTKPIEDGYRMPGEFEKHKGTYMIWPERTDNWRLGAKPAQKVFTEVANTIAKQEKPTIIVDAGHGGFDGGAVKGNLNEKDINLQFALSLETMFKAYGFNVVMTRTTDSGTEDAGLDTIRRKKVSDIKNRLSLIESKNAECFISLHQNMFSIEKYNGSQVFYSSHKNSEIFANQIQTSIKNYLQPDNNRQIKAVGKNIYLLYHTTKPAVLVECGFMSNDNELRLLLQNEYQNKLNFCILNGVLMGRKSILNG